MITPIQKGKAPLRPRARIIRTIGEELISNDNVAIIELVKNSYDADAKKVEIIFNEPLTEKQGSIVIKDDGSGMTLKTVKEGWMEPATVIKTVNRKSGKGRKLLGEKGIGRFASAKLSKNLDMITKTKDDNEVYAHFNWEHFSNDKKYLDEVDCEWEVRKPQVIEKYGTVLVLKDLNSNWNEDKLRQLKIALSRLINPFNIIKDFKIELILPKKFEKLAGVISSPASLSKPDYFIKGNVNMEGTLNFDYESRKTNNKVSFKQKINLKPSRVLQCGPFDFELRVWNREKQNLMGLATELGSTLRNIEQDLNEAAGISVYRDGFRVLPYGEPKTDWLRLDIRRVNNPTLRLSNNQISGYISISLEKNHVLVDQSNREGIVESSAFNDLKESIVAILNELEIRRYGERPRQEKKATTAEGIFSKISMSPVIDMVNKKLPGDTEAKQIVAETDTAIKEGIQQVQEVLSRYRRLSTLGLLLDAVLHDGNNILLRLDNEVCLFEAEFNKNTVSHEKMTTHIRNIKQERQTLSQLFKRLEPFGGRKRGKPKNIILEDAIKNVFALFNGKLEKLRVETTLPNSHTEVKFDEAELEIIFVNLLENSLYWLDTLEQKEKKITVEIIRKENELCIVFSDNGPGVEEEYVERIFEPYFSRKPDGIGLGLTIVGELIIEYDGSFELINNGPLDGASFRITFRRRI